MRCGGMRAYMLVHISPASHTRLRGALIQCKVAAGEWHLMIAWLRLLCCSAPPFERMLGGRDVVR